MTSKGRGAVLAVASYDANTVDFYLTPSDPFAGSPFPTTPNFTWDKKTGDKTGWIDKNFGKYQNINLVTQSDGTIFMIAFNRDGYTDWMDLFEVDFTSTEVVLKKLAKKHMYCSDGCQFDFGAGIFIESATGFSVYAVKDTSGDHITGTTIHANFFAAA